MTFDSDSSSILGLVGKTKTSSRARMSSAAGVVPASVLLPDRVELSPPPAAGAKAASMMPSSDLAIWCSSHKPVLKLDFGYTLYSQFRNCYSNFKVLWCLNLRHDLNFSGSNYPKN